MTIFTILLAVLLIAPVGAAWSEEALAASPQGKTAVGQENTVNHYVCPMHPQIVRDQEDRCPICGMELAVVKSGDDEEPMPMVTVAAEMVHALGVRTAAVEHRTLWRRIDTVGYVEYDRSKLSHVYGPAEGFIRGLTLSSEGERVKRGQFLFKLSSPMLSSYYDKTFAEQDGIVVALNVIEGEFVTPRTKLLTLADLSTVWVLADVFEGQAAWVKVGQAAEVRLPYVSGQIWEGKVEYVYPNLDPETRTLKVRLRFDNPDEVLRPNMHAEVVIYGGPKEGVLTIPREALIETGKEQRVVAALGRGRYQPRRVVVGMEQGDWVEVADGLEVGDQVVVSGQFLLDSESSLKASLRRLSRPAAR